MSVVADEEEEKVHDLDDQGLIMLLVQLCSLALVQLLKSRKGDLGELRDDLVQLLTECNKRVASRVSALETLEAARHESME